MEADASAHAAPSARRVLVVEDNDGFVALLAAWLPHDVVVRAAGLKEAVAAMAGGPSPDVVLLDLTLPDSRGPLLVDRLRKAGCSAPIVVLCGQDDPQVADRCLSLGAAAYLVKGRTDAETLSTTLDRALRPPPAPADATVARRGERRRVLAAAAAIFALLTVARVLVPPEYQGITGGFVLPITLVAYALGLRWALGAALAATATFTAWAASTDVLMPFDALTRCAVFVSCAALAAWLSRRLAAARALSDGILAASGDALFVKDAAGRYVFVNEEAQRALGRTAPELLGRTAADAGFESAFHRAADRRDAEVIASGRAQHYEDVAIVGGVRRVLSLHRQPIALPGGRGVLVAARDITEQRDAQDVSWSFFETSRELLATATPDGRFVDLNGSWTRVLGWTEDELLAEPFIAFVHPDDVQRTIDETAVAAADGSTNFRNRYRCKDGSYRWLDWRSSPSDDGAVIFAAARDVTDQVAVEEALAASQHQLRELVDQLPDTIVLRLDADLRVEVVGGGALRDSVVAPEDIVGRTIDEVLEGGYDDSDELLAAYRDAAAGTARSVEYVDARTDRWFEVSVTPLRSRDGQVTGVLAVARNVTARVERDREVRRLAAVIDSTDDAVLIGDADANIVSGNRAALELHRCTADELLGPAARFVAEDDTCGPAVGEALKAGRPWHGERRMRRADGTVFDAAVTYSPQMAGGRLASASAVVRDVTARKTAERALREATARFSASFDNAPIGIALVAPDGTWLEVNGAVCELVGYPAEILLTKTFQDITHPDDLDTDLALLEDVLAGRRQKYTLDKRYIHADGHEVWVSLSVSLVRDDDGAPLYFVSQIKDIGARKRGEVALRAAEARFRGAFDHAPVGMAITSLRGRLTACNAALTTMTGHGEDALLTMTLQSLLHPDELASVDEGLAGLLSGNVLVWTGERRYLHLGGQERWTQLHVSVLRDEHGQAASLLVQALDVTDRRHFEGQLRHMAEHDPLTGLRNRRRFEQDLERHAAECERYGHRGALLLLDLDNFKEVNDTLGHNAGDELIVSTAATLRARLRDTDTVARLGGDEFAVLLPHADREEADRVAELLVRAVHEQVHLLNDTLERKVSTSIGVAMFTAGLTGPEVLVNADLAMYDAKDDGRNGYSHYATETHDQPRTAARMAWNERIRQALAEERFVLHAQPILDLATDVVHQHELLLRMRDDHGDLIPPVAFLYVAEKSDLIFEIDRWVARRAIDLLAASPGGPALEMNISGRSLGDPTLLDLIEQRLAITGIDPTRLIIEVTETAAVSDVARARDFAERLSRIGCRFALDDFGAGFGSFYYLKHLPFDLLKIDGEFVTACTRSRTDRVVIDALVQLARGLGKQTVAEFVCAPEILEYVRASGVDFAQGYQIGPPVPVGEIIPGAAASRTSGAPPHRRLPAGSGP